MTAFIIIAIIVGIVVFGVSFLGAALHFLLWVGIIIVVLAIIGWIVRRLTGSRA